MSCKPFSLSRNLLVATALSFVACGVALADDSSASRFGGDGYAYFSQPVRDGTATAAAWRRNHPTGLSQRELQAAGASSLAVWQLPDGAEPGSANVAQFRSKQGR